MSSYDILLKMEKSIEDFNIQLEKLKTEMKDQEHIRKIEIKFQQALTTITSYLALQNQDEHDGAILDVLSTMNAVHELDSSKIYFLNSSEGFLYLSPYFSCRDKKREEKNVDRISINQIPYNTILASKEIQRFFVKEKHITLIPLVFTEIDLGILEVVKSDTNLPKQSIETLQMSAGILIYLIKNSMRREAFYKFINGKDSLATMKLRNLELFDRDIQIMKFIENLSSILKEREDIELILDKISSLVAQVLK